MNSLLDVTDLFEATEHVVQLYANGQCSYQENYNWPPHNYYEVAYNGTTDFEQKMLFWERHGAKQGENLDLL